MTMNPQIIIPVVTAVTALILLMAGGRLLRPAVGLAGGLFGAGCGLLLAPSLGIDVSPLIIALITGIIAAVIDRKSTRLNSSHVVISYAVFCLKKKKKYKDGTEAVKGIL